MLARTPREPFNLYRVARAVGVVLREAKDHSPTSIRPRHCFCKSKLKRLGQAYGESHVALVLKLIIESGNENELHASTIDAVSTLLLSGQVEIGSELFEAFDAIDLGRLRRGVRPLAVPTADAMAGALLALLRPPVVARGTAIR